MITNKYKKILQNVLISKNNRYIMLLEITKRNNFNKKGGVIC